MSRTTTTALVPDDLGLAMSATPPNGAHGTWQPRSTDLLQELPALLQEMQRRGVAVTRVSYPLGEWDDVARKVQLGGRLVRLGGFRTMPAHTVRLTGTADQALVLDVVGAGDGPAGVPVTA